MTTAGTVTVDVQGRDVNLVALLTRLEGQMRQTDQVGIRLSQTTGGTFTQAQQRAANAAITEAQAIARAAIAAGDDARAHDILVTALGNSAAAGDRQVASLTAQIAKLQSGSTFAQQFGSSLQSSLLGIIGPAALAGAAIRGVSEAGELIKLGAQAEVTRARFDQLAQQAGTTGNAMTAALRQASGGTIADTNLQLAAMKANLLGVGSSAAQLGPLLAIARDRAQQMGISTEFAFDSLVTGLGRGSRLILDNIGVIVKESQVNEAYARAVGKTVEQLTDQEKKQALINEVMRQGQETIAATGGAIETTATKIERMNASIDNAKAKLGGLLALKFGPVAEDIGTVADSLTGTAGAFDGLQAASSAIGGAFGWLNPVIGGISDYNTAVLGAAQSTAEWLGITAGSNTAIVSNAAANDFAAQAANASAAANQAAAQAVTFSAGVYDIQAQAALIAANSLEQQAAALEAEAASSQLNAVQSQALTVEKDRLAQQAQFTAQSLIASGQAGAAAAAQLANSSSLIDRLTAAYYRLAVAQQAAKPTGGAGVTEGRLERDTAADRAQVGSDKALEAQKTFLAKLNATHKAAGGVRLSDQQKLNNQLADQQQRYNDQAEQQAREHSKRLIDIQRDYERKSLEQQQKNELSKRESELGFLESITGSELNKTKSGREEIARINERFYADFDAAQKAAQAGNAEQSERLVELARKRADAELEYAQKIAEAQANRDAGEVARLEALREKRRQILDEEQKQIAGGGDKNVNERDQALADEQKRYEEQQGKLADSAESAADRKVNAAVRSGKAVAAETAQLREQEQIYNRIGARGGAAPAAGGGTTAPATAAGGPATIDWGAVTSLLQAVVDAVNTQGGTVATAATNAGDKVARAVGARLAGA